MWLQVCRLTKVNNNSSNTNHKPDPTSHPSLLRDHRAESLIRHSLRQDLTVVVVAEGILAAPEGVDAVVQQLEEFQDSSDQSNGVLLMALRAVPPTKDPTLPWQWIALPKFHIVHRPHPPSTLHHLAILEVYSSMPPFLLLELPATIAQDMETPTIALHSVQITRMQDSLAVIRMEGSRNKQEEGQGS